MDVDRWMMLLAVVWAPPVLALAWLLERLAERARARAERRLFQAWQAGRITQPAATRRRRYGAVEAWLLEVRRTRGLPPTAPPATLRPERQFTPGRQARARRRFDRLGPSMRRGTALALLTRDSAVRLLAGDPRWQVRVLTNGEVRCWR